MQFSDAMSEPGTHPWRGVIAVASGTIVIGSVVALSVVKGGPHGAVWAAIGVLYSVFSLLLFWLFARPRGVVWQIVLGTLLFLAGPTLAVGWGQALNGNDPELLPGYLFIGVTAGGLAVLFVVLRSRRMRRERQLGQANPLRYAVQEWAASLVVLSAFLYLVADAVRSLPAEAPSLWPLIPFFAGLGWHAAIGHFRSTDQHAR